MAAFDTSAVRVAAVRIEAWLVQSRPKFRTGEVTDTARDGSATSERIVAVRRKPCPLIKKANGKPVRAIKARPPKVEQHHCARLPDWT